MLLACNEIPACASTNGLLEPCHLGYGHSIQTAAERMKGKRTLEEQSEIPETETRSKNCNNWAKQYYEGQCREQHLRTDCALTNTLLRSVDKRNAYFGLLSCNFPNISSREGKVKDVSTLCSQPCGCSHVSDAAIVLDKNHRHLSLVNKLKCTVNYSTASSSKLWNLALELPNCLNSCFSSSGCN